MIYIYTTINGKLNVEADDPVCPKKYKICISNFGGG